MDKANQVYVAKLGIGLLPPRHDELTGFGHMWLYWKSPEKEKNPYRGYYPVEEEIPTEYRDYNKWPRFFARYCVRGRYQIDLFAMNIIKELDENKFFTKEWSITKEQLSRLRRECFIPEDENYVIKGYYSWNQKRPDWHNCSSWVISVVNYILNRKLIIKEFDTSYEPAYRIKFENINPAFSLFVYRNEGSVLFGKSSVSANVIDGFELKPNNGKIELLLHITDNFGSHTYLIGKIDDKDERIKADGEAWIAEVNQFYENHRKRQAEVEAAG